MIAWHIFAKHHPAGFLRGSIAPVIVFSVLFHGLFFAGIILMTKALYKSKEFERPYTFELIRLSQVFSMPHPGAAPAQRLKSAERKISVPVPVPAPHQQVSVKKSVPEEKKTVSSAQQPPVAPSAEPASASAPAANASAPASASAPVTGRTGPAADSSVSADRVYDAAMVDEPPVPLKGNQKPFYPEFVKDQGISGTVKAQIVIDQNGSVIEINIQSSPHELLSDEVYKAVSRWKYRPARFKGIAVKVKTRDVRIEFQLTD